MVLFTVIENKTVNYNVMKLTVDSPDLMESPEISYLIRLCDRDGNRRPYTPIRHEGTTLVFYIKVYEEGVVSKFLGNLKEGDTLEGSGFLCKRKYTPNEFKTIMFIAGGTGITPCLQVMREIANNPEDNTKCILYNFNTEELDHFADMDCTVLVESSNMTVINRFTHGIQGRKKLTGNLSIEEDNTTDESVIANPITDKTLSSDAEDTLFKFPAGFDFVYVCGTAGFLDVICGRKEPDKSQGELTGVLGDLGYTKEKVYKF